MMFSIELNLILLSYFSKTMRCKQRRLGDSIYEYNSDRLTPSYQNTSHIFFDQNNILPHIYNNASIYQIKYKL